MALVSRRAPVHLTLSDTSTWRSGFDTQSFSQKHFPVYNKAFYNDDWQLSVSVQWPGRALACPLRTKLMGFICNALLVCNRLSPLLHCSQYLLLKHQGGYLLRAISETGRKCWSDTEKTFHKKRITEYVNRGIRYNPERSCED